MRITRKLWAIFSCSCWTIWIITWNRDCLWYYDKNLCSSSHIKANVEMNGIIWSSAYSLCLLYGGSHVWGFPPFHIFWLDMIMWSCRFHSQIISCVMFIQLNADVWRHALLCPTKSNWMIPKPFINARHAPIFKSIRLLFFQCMLIFLNISFIYFFLPEVHFCSRSLQSFMAW